MLQIENEYGSVLCDHAYTIWLRDIVREQLGNDVVLYTSRNLLISKCQNDKMSKKIYFKLSKEKMPKKFHFKMAKGQNAKNIFFQNVKSAKCPEIIFISKYQNDKMIKTFLFQNYGTCVVYTP